MLSHGLFHLGPYCILPARHKIWSILWVYDCFALFFCKCGSVWEAAAFSQCFPGLWYLTSARMDWFISLSLILVHTHKILVTSNWNVGCTSDLSRNKEENYMILFQRMWKFCKVENHIPQTGNFFSNLNFSITFPKLLCSSIVISCVLSIV